MHLKVLSWNILSDHFTATPEDMVYYPGLKPDQLKGPKRWPTIINFLKKAKAHVIFLQEVCTDFHELLIAHMKRLYKVTNLIPHNYTASQCMSNTGLCMLIRHGVMNHIRQHSTYVCQTDNAVQLVTGHVLGIPAVLVNCHLQSEPEVHDIRTCEMRGILEFIVQKSACSEGLILIGGDFNTDYAPTLELLTKAQFTSLIQKPSSTYLCEAPQIDHLFMYMAPPRKTIIVESGIHNNPWTKHGPTAPCFQETIQSVGSDHYPIWSVVKLN